MVIGLFGSTLLASQIGEHAGQALARGQAVDPALSAQPIKLSLWSCTTRARGATCELAPNICYQWPMLSERMTAGSAVVRWLRQ